MYWILIIWILGVGTSSSAHPVVIPVSFHDEQSCKQTAEVWEQKHRSHQSICIPINGDLK